jgi:hypothetical protein
MACPASRRSRIRARGGAEQVALENSGDGDLVSLVVDDVAPDLDMLGTERIAGDGGGEVEQEQGTPARGSA